MIRDYRISTLYILVWIVLIACATFFNSYDVAFTELSEQKILELKLIQVFSAFVIFAAPALIFVKLFASNGFYFLELNRLSSFKNLMWVVVLFLVAIPGINLLAERNASLHLPESFRNFENWARAAEQQAKVMTYAFLNMKSISDLIINIFVIGFVAAFTEELFFRGMIQKHLVQLFESPHIAIWLSAALFSFLHGQFLGFFPRLLLGAMLGYVFHYSNSLWASIIGHFINNSIQVIIAYALLDHFNIEEINTMQSSTAEQWIGYISGVCTVVFMIHFIRNNKSELKFNKNLNS